jgi:hypothetical protein
MQAVRNTALVATLLLIGVLLHAAPSAAQTTGTISGTVTAAGTGAPVFSGGGESVWVEAYTAAGAPHRSILVQAPDGRYEMTVEPGTYVLRTRGPSGYVAQLHANLPCNATDCRVTNGTPVTVTAGSASVIDFALVEGARMTGTVRRAADGSPIRDIQVAIVNASGSHERSVYTDADGAFVGRYRLLIVRTACGGAQYRIPIDVVISGQ